MYTRSIIFLLFLLLSIPIYSIEKNTDKLKEKEELKSSAIFYLVWGGLYLATYPMREEIRKSSIGFSYGSYVTNNTAVLSTLQTDKSLENLALAYHITSLNRKNHEEYKVDMNNYRNAEISIIGLFFLASYYYFNQYQNFEKKESLLQGFNFSIGRDESNISLRFYF
jgi:hypothetical protein